MILLIWDEVTFVQDPNFYVCRIYLDLVMAFLDLKFRKKKNFKNLCCDLVKKWRERRKKFNIWGFVLVKLCRFEFPLEKCSLLSVSQLLSVWKAEEKLGCLAPGEEMDLGKDIDVTEVLLRSSPASQSS